MIVGSQNSYVRQPVSTLLRDYDACFAEFLRPSGNGQKIVQAILMRAAFDRFAKEGIAIRQDTPTTILDVSCGPGDFSVAWTSDIAKALPAAMVFYCTDRASGVSRTTGEKYTTATINKMRAAALRGNLVLAKPPIGIDADLFSGDDRLMMPGKHADVIHWSHSGYHVRDALGFLCQARRGGLGASEATGTVGVAKSGGIAQSLLLNFIAYDFSNPDAAALEKLAQAGELADFVDAFKLIVAENRGHVFVKCAFQLIARSQDIAMKLNAIAGQLRRDMPAFLRQMPHQTDGRDDSKLVS
jgi:hypothetical protein